MIIMGCGEKNAKSVNDTKNTKENETSCMAVRPRCVMWLVGGATVLVCSLQMVTVAALVTKAAVHSSIEGVIIDCLSAMHKRHRVMEL
jgi:hypothetical protein